MPAAIPITKLAADFYRQYYRPRLKVAAPGDDQEVPFEQAFANLAFVYLKDKAPQLIDYLLGFQLVRRDQDNSKAMGIFGFQLGKEWLFVPVFFINGELKGHELLYTKSNGRFLPLDENWVEYLLGKQPKRLGEAAWGTLRQMGALQPNLSDLNFAPLSQKFSSSSEERPPEIAGWCKPLLPDLGHAVTGQIEKIGSDFLDALAGSPIFVKRARQLFHQYPEFEQSFLRFYKREDLDVAEKKAWAKLPWPKVIDPLLATPSSPTKKAVVVHKWDTSYGEESGVLDLTPEERQKMVSKGYVVKDRRSPDEKSKLYLAEIKLELTGPSRTGVYELLTKPHDFTKTLVIAQPMGAWGRRDCSTLVELEGDKRHTNAKPAAVWVKGTPVENWRTWFDALPNPEAEPGKRYVAVGPYEDGSLPFTVEESLGDEVYTVYFDKYIEPGQPDYNFHGRTHRGWEGEHSDKKVTDRVTCGAPGVKIHGRAGELFVPDSWKLIEIAKYDLIPLQPQHVADVHLDLTQPGRFKIARDGDEFYRLPGTGRLDKLAAAFSLILDHGLGEKEAFGALEMIPPNGSRDFVLKAASMCPECHKDPCVCEKEKYAAEMSAVPWGSGGGQSPPFPDPQVVANPFGSLQHSPTAEVPYETVMRIPTNRTVDPFSQDPRYIPDPRAMQMAQTASQTGQKELFNVSAFSALLDSLDEHELIGADLDIHFKEIDTLGRTLFKLFWHKADFESEYGREGAVEFEDSVRNVFQALGKLTLSLLQKGMKATGLDSSSEGLLAVARN